MRTMTLALLLANVTLACGNVGDGEDGDGSDDVVTDDVATDDVATDSSCVGLTGGPCNVVEQCGCTEGNACQVQIDTDPDPCVAAEVCLPRTGGLDVGDECERSDQCRVGSSCLSMGMPERHCFEWCRTDEDCSDAGVECFLSVNWTSPPDSPTCPGETITPPYLVCTLP